MTAIRITGWRGRGATRAYAALRAETWPDVFVYVTPGSPAIVTELAAVDIHEQLVTALGLSQRARPDRNWASELRLLQRAARRCGREPRAIVVRGDVARLEPQLRDLAFGWLELPCVIALGARRPRIDARGMKSVGRRRLCMNLVVRSDGAVIHRCDLTSLAIPPEAMPVLDALHRGATPSGVPPKELAPFVATLAQLGWFHRPGRPSARAPAIVRARVDVANAPLLTARELVSLPVPDDDVGVRYSSGATPVQTVVENAVRRERLVAKVLVQPRAVAARSVHINRPANLGLVEPAAGWPAFAHHGESLAITPGPNPTTVSAEVWRRVIASVVAHAPEQLDGDPAYLAGFAHACIANDIALSLSSIMTGHGYAWRIYRAAIERAFGIAPISRLHSSELGDIAIECRLGRMHLLDVNAYYEVIAHGRQARRGEVGALVATTLDTRIRPLVRYVTGDLVRVTSTSCACGKPFRTIAFEGRATDGAPPYSAIDAAVGAGLRFFQLELATATLRVVEPACDLEPVRDRVARLLSRSVALEVVAALPVPERGKLHSIVRDSSRR